MHEKNARSIELMSTYFYYIVSGIGLPVVCSYKRIEVKNLRIKKILEKFYLLTLKMHLNKSSD